MKKFAFIFLLPYALCLMPLSTHAARQKHPSKNEINGPVAATVNYIFDGDTFAAAVKIADDIEISVRIRIKQIDAPELEARCDAERTGAIAAKNRLAELLPDGAHIQLYNIKDDKYLGRIDANVHLSDGRDVGEIMVTGGFAREYNGGKRAGWCDESGLAH